MTSLSQQPFTNAEDIAGSHGDQQIACGAVFK